jgi:hypothetical protein
VTRCHCCGQRLGVVAHRDRNLRAWCEVCRAACTLVGPTTVARGASCPLLVRRYGAPATIVELD